LSMGTHRGERVSSIIKVIRGGSSVAFLPENTGEEYAHILRGVRNLTSKEFSELPSAELSFSDRKKEKGERKGSKQGEALTVPLEGSQKERNTSKEVNLARF